MGRAVLPLAALAAAAAPPEFSIEARKAEDRVVTAVTNGCLVVSVASPSGIGSARITLAAGAWPARAVIRLALGGLEGFSVDNGRRRLEGFLPRPGQPGPAAPELKIARLADGVIEVTVPRELLDPPPAFLAITWVDFYR